MRNLQIYILFNRILPNYGNAIFHTISFNILYVPLKGDMPMKDIKNSNGKLVCKVDEKNKIIEIVHKGHKTILQFSENGKLVVLHTQNEN